MSNTGRYILNLVDDRFEDILVQRARLRARLAEVTEERRRCIKSGELPAGANPEPTFGDIARSHFLQVAAQYKPYVNVAWEYVKVPARGWDGYFGESAKDVTFDLPAVGDFLSDIVVHVRIAEIGDAAAYAAGEAPTPQTPYLRYCAYPGLRMLAASTFSSDNVAIDTYTNEDAIAFTNQFVTSDKLVAWQRCHGQQELKQATYFANGFTGQLAFYRGPQTPSVYHGPLDLYVPLQFWMCRDASAAILNDRTTNSSRQIRLRMGPLGALVEALLPIGGTLERGPLPFSRLRAEVNMYMNNLFVDNEVYQVFAKRLGFSLVRVHRRQDTSLGTPEGRVLLNNLNFPIEHMTVYVRDRTVNDFDRWWQAGSVPVTNDTTKLLVPAMIWNSSLNICQLVCREATQISALDGVLDQMGVTSQGVTIYPLLPAVAYSSYSALRYPDKNRVVAPGDPSMFLVSFCMYPGDYNPSGTFNASTSREFYLDYKMKPGYFPGFSPDRYSLVVSASAINFLVRNGDKLSLRYAV